MCVCGCVFVLGNMLTETLLLPNTPGLLSPGVLEKSGFSSLWAHGYLPCLIENDIGKLIVFDICANLPMIVKGRVFDIIRQQATLKRLCGVEVINNKITVPCLQRCEDKGGIDLLRRNSRDIQKDEGKGNGAR